MPAPIVPAFLHGHVPDTIAPRVSRLAPSPTGSLHLGNARTFLINWALARKQGWRLLMRIEDLDGPRIKRNAAAEMLDLLSWLGIDYDGEVPISRATWSHIGPQCERSRSEAWCIAAI